MRITPPYLVFLGDVPDSLAAETAFGIRDWRPDWCRALVAGAPFGTPGATDMVRIAFITQEHADAAR